MTDLTHPAYPRASAYAADWLLALDMGPNPLWLLEDLLGELDLRPGQRVLDLGSGLGASAVFLARECDVEVWAADLWVDADTAARTFLDAGVGDVVHAVQADARALPFEAGFFDAVVSVDAWEYFGTDDHFLPRLLEVVPVGGQIGMVTPAMHRDVRSLGRIPDHIAHAVGWEALAWHAPEWWRQQWTLSGLVDVTCARAHPDAWANWLRWERARPAPAEAVIDMLEADAGELLTFAVVAGRKR